MDRFMSTLCAASHCVQNCHCLSGEKENPAMSNGWEGRNLTKETLWWKSGRERVYVWMGKSRWQKKEKGKLLTVLSLFIALRKAFKLESKLECQQADTKALISSIWKGVDLGTFAREAWPLLCFVKCGCLRDSVFVCTRVRERENRGPRLISAEAEHDTHYQPWVHLFCR